MKKSLNEKDITNNAAGVFLGKHTEGSSVYDPSLLVAVPRQPNREHYEIESENLPFAGFDVWHAYEFSTLTSNGLPVTRVLKLRYDCTSEFIVESKSLKLYLNSYNMYKTGSTTEEVLNSAKVMIEHDLGEKLKTKVEAYFLPPDTKRLEIYQNFQNILEIASENTINCTKYKEAPKVLKTSALDEVKTHYLMFDSLRSNCRVTHQPDFGDVFIYYKSKKHIDEASLVEYLVSFRSEYHFHEECCEMIYKRLYDILDKATDELMVCALYTRRGGIDICPCRYSKNCKIPDNDMLFDITKLAKYGIKG